MSPEVEDLLVELRELRDYFERLYGGDYVLRPALVVYGSDGQVIDSAPVTTFNLDKALDEVAK
jgi:hypothetical protein